MNKNDITEGLERVELLKKLKQDLIDLMDEVEQSDEEKIVVWMEKLLSKYIIHMENDYEINKLIFTPNYDQHYVKLLAIQRESYREYFDKLKDLVNE